MTRRRSRLALGPLAALALLGGLVALGERPTAGAPTAGVEAPDGAISAETLRSCELPADPEEGSRLDRVLLGLAAYACDRPEEAVARLAVEPEPGARFEDWRLYALADAAAATDDLRLAAEAVDLLLLNHPGSLLRHRALALRARTAFAAGEPERALSMARASRAILLPGELRAELDVVAWQAASLLERTVDIEQEARALLLHSPVEASDLGVADSLRDDSGAIVWSDHFLPWELLGRAERLIDAGLVDEAMATLDGYPEGDRGTSWYLLRIRALIDDRRGVEALREIEALGPADDATALEVAWLRSLAALDASIARRGRTNLGSSERAEMSRLAREELARIAATWEEDPLAVAALRLLFEELADGEHFTEVRQVLQALRRLDATDTTGANYLWRLGWNQYGQRNYTGAVGYWRELIELYPETKAARSATYWSARSHEALGAEARSRAMYEEVASARAPDYYRVHALRRLGRPDAPAEPVERMAVERWPTDPILARAESLSDLGIDRLGLEELELVEAPPAAYHALRSRILARQGLRRDSIQSLWRVFPMLGTANQVRAPLDALRMYYPTDFKEIVARFARENRLAVPLLMAMIRQESAFDVKARSWAGARGLMQVMPATARELAQRMGLPYSRERLNDPAYSVQLGSRYFRQVLDMFDGDLELALAGYNAGPYRIRKLLGRSGPDVEPDAFLEGLRIEESKTYVKRVVLFANSYRQLYPDLG